jgi:hypothetical protein
MSSLVLRKSFACLVVICGSPWISLAERSCSSFALVVSYAGEDLFPLSGKANEGCQWEVQTDDGWTPYWDPQA